MKKPTHEVHLNTPSSMTHFPKPKKEATKQGSKDDVGFNLDGTTPIVPLLEPHSYEGDSPLRFANEPLPIDKSIPEQHTTKKLPSGKVSYNSVFMPPPPNEKEQKLEDLTPHTTPDVNTETKFKEEEKPLRRSTRSTRWIPGKVTKALKMSAIGIGMLFLPTHIVSESTIPEVPGLQHHQM